MSQENFNNDIENIVDYQDININEKPNNQSAENDNTIDKNNISIKIEESPIKISNKKIIETENNEQNVNSPKNKNKALDKIKSSKNLFLSIVQYDS